MLPPPLETGISLFDAKQIRALELDFADRHKCPTFKLMELAGAGAFKVLRSRWPEAKKILVLTGKGNNGGDGFIVARLAVEDGLSVTLCGFCPESQLQGDAAIAYKQLPHRALTTLEWADVNVADFDLIVDGLLGTGIVGKVRKPFVNVIEAVNASPKAVMSLDIPSGLNSDSGVVVNTAIRADVTVTFIGHKRGLYTGDAPDFRGQVILDPLGITTQEIENSKIRTSVFAHDWHSYRKYLPPRRPASHKGNYGHCLVVGGASGMPGAAVLASTAAARAGSGLTSALLETGADVLIARQPEVMAQNITKDEVSALLERLEQASSLVIGPGMGQKRWGRHWMESLMVNPHFLKTNKVIDADGLNWLVENPHKNPSWVLTPHPGEAARLLNCTTSEINNDRFAAGNALVARYGGVCVLKGAGTIVSCENGEQVVCAVGNPGMATGGMGDVLAGIIGGLLAQGLPLQNAAIMGVCIHGEAAQQAAGPKGYYRGMLASDLFQYFPELLNPN